MYIFKGKRSKRLAKNPISGNIYIHMIKTNKSYTKRLKVSKNGKVTARGVGHGHFNARQTRREQLNKNRQTSFHMSNKSKSLFLA